MELTALKCLANFICGDEGKGPLYRSSSNLTEFFKLAGFPQFVHDGSTRRYWVQDSLEELLDEEQREVVKTLADPRLYEGNRETALSAINLLNKFLYLENIEVRLNGSRPELIAISDVEMDRHPDSIIRAPFPIIPWSISSETAVLVLQNRWNEAQICSEQGAYTMALVAMGSILEGLLGSFISICPRESNQARSAPKRNGEVLPFSKWSLSDRITVAAELEWIGSGIKKYSDILREYRNMVHPDEQARFKDFPGKSECAISWEVVKATVSGLGDTYSKMEGTFD